MKLTAAVLLLASSHAFTSSSDAAAAALRRALASDASASASSAEAAAEALRQVSAPRVSRRNALTGGALAAAVSAFADVAVVDASGGATAGGAYLLRAKERYNARVVAGAKAFKAAGDDATPALFAEDGPLADLEAAGFLLANAFRINSTQNPDKIPQVKLFKAFKADADAVAAALKKKKKADAKAGMEKAQASLDAYLAGVGL